VDQHRAIERPDKQHGKHKGYINRHDNKEYVSINSVYWVMNQYIMYCTQIQTVSKEPGS